MHHSTQTIEDPPNPSMIRQPSKWHWWWMLLWLFVVFILGNKPVHLDEANFLALTRGNWWSPHDIQINWEGVTESAFDVLSNPPGQAWVLWPVKDQSTLWMRVWMLPWVFAAVWGTWRCIQHYQGNVWWLWCVICSPIFALSHNSLMPEMPLYTCIVLGWQGVLRQRYMALWAVVLGCSALFRYSGMTMIPLLGMWVFVHRPKNGWMLILSVLSPAFLLMLHDLAVYEQWHFWHMIAFQQATHTWEEVFYKLFAFSSMLVLGCGVVPKVSKRNWRPVSASALFTILVVSQLSLQMTWLGWLSVILGMVLSAQLIHTMWRERSVWMLCWFVGGVVFLLGLRFAATRYWLPFVLPAWLYAHRQLNMQRWTMKAYCGVLLIVSIHLVYDDAQLAHSQHKLAEQVQTACLEQYGDSVGYFAGHWGWQYAQEQSDWMSINDNDKIPNNVCFSYSLRTWPQETSSDCFEMDSTYTQKYRPLLFPIRVHTVDGLANYHSFMISNRPPIRTVTPFGWGHDPWDSAVLRRSCRR